MKIKHYVSKKVEETEAIICNSCEKIFSQMKSNDLGESEIETFEGISVNNTFGYHSEYFFDETKIQFSLCEKCLFDLVKGFKVPVLTNEHPNDKNKIGQNIDELAKTYNRLKNKQEFKKNLK